MRVILHSKSQIVADIPGFQREPDEERADADLTAEGAGRLCYLSGHRPNPKTATNPDYLLNIQNERHYSVLGHAAVTFYIDGISRNCTHEIIRSRWFTFSEVSQRYVNASKFSFVRHPGLESLLGDSENNLMDLAWDTAQDAYSAIVDNLTDEGGLGRKEARQAARHVLPGGTETKILMSGNLRAWRDFLAQRLPPAADLEIRQVALEIYHILKKEFPNSFQDFDSQGMITVERLVKRALDRHDATDYAFADSRTRNAQTFIHEVREILEKGLWVLKADPWEEDKIGSRI